MVKDGSYVYDEPVKCVVGYKNPDAELHLNNTEFCEIVEPEDLPLFQGTDSAGSEGTDPSRVGEDTAEVADPISTGQGGSGVETVTTNLSSNSEAEGTENVTGLAAGGRQGNQ